MLERAEPAHAAAAEPELETPEAKALRLVRDAIAELRPFLQSDGGDCELVGIEGNLVKVRMKGACVGCQLASVTIHGIQERLIAKLGMPLRIVPVPGGF
jgi:NifU-like protein